MTDCHQYLWPSGLRVYGSCRLGDAPVLGGAIIQGGQQMVLISYVLASLHRDEEGQGLAEYALILALIAIVAIVALLFLGGKVSTVLSTVGGSL